MKIINDIGAPQALIDAFLNDDYDGYHADKISVTTLIDAPYVSYMRTHHNNEAEALASNMLWMLDGSAIHYALERAGSKYITELRLEQKYNGITISGKFDMYDPVTGVLWDYKRTSVWNVIHNPDGKKEWIAQLNLNKWLMDAHGFSPAEIKVLVFLKDWSRTESLRNSSYPKKPIVVVDVEQWTWTQLTDYLYERTELHKKARNGDITPCTDQERWAKPTTYACMKDGASRASRVFNTLTEAQAFVLTKPDYKIETREGEFVRCDRYCSYKPFCIFYKQEQVVLKETQHDTTTVEDLFG